MVSSQKPELSLVVFNEKGHFCVESASQWVWCCKDFLSTLSLTFGSKPPKDALVFILAITPGARISILKKISLLSSRILTLNQWYNSQLIGKEWSIRFTFLKLFALPPFIIKERNHFCFSLTSTTKYVKL